MEIVQYMPKASYIMLKGYRFYFSYSTLIGVSKPDGSYFVRNNDWSNTTAKHMKFIDGGGKAAKDRLDKIKFDEEVKKLCTELEIEVPVIHVVY